jgi:hypothetical protein
MFHAELSVVRFLCFQGVAGVLLPLAASCWGLVLIFMIDTFQIIQA